MRRLAILAVVIVIGAFSLIAASAQQAARGPRTKARQIQRVKGNLYFIPGSDRNTYAIGDYATDAAVRTMSTGGNTAVWITDRGVVLVDTMNPGYGPELIAQVRSVTDQPITMIINTHTHSDHTGSNIEFPATVEFVAHENTQANLSQEKCAPVTNCAAFKGDNVKFLPKRTFKDKMTVLEGHDRIDLYYFGRGHTNGDSWVVFPAVGTLHSGDMFQRKNMPFIDATDSGGDAFEFARTLTRAAAGIKNVDSVIAGHSPTVLTWNDFKEYTGYYAEFVASAQRAKRTGKSVDEAVSTYQPSAQYRNYEIDAARVKQNIASIYAAIP